MGINKQGESIRQVLLCRDYNETDPEDQVTFRLSSAVVYGKDGVELPLPDAELDILGQLASDGWNTQVSEGTVKFTQQWGSAGWVFNTPIGDYYKGLEVTFADAPALTSNFKVGYGDGSEEDFYYGSGSTSYSHDFKAGTITKITVYGNNDEGTTYPYSITMSSCKLVRRAVEIGTCGYATFSNTNAVDFSRTTNLTAYIATVNGNKVDLTPVTKVPANTGVVLNAEADSYPFAVAHGATDDVSGNDLQVSDGSITGDGSIYVLANGNSVVGFYRLKSGETLPAGKAYLTISQPSSNARDFFGFDNMTTGIIERESLPIATSYYNLAGQRVSQSARGLLIANGKKIIVK